jgi:hypothetical protein
MKEMDKLSSELLFEIQKAFYDERGKGARYRLVTIGVPYMKSIHPECFSSVEKVRKALLESGMANDVQLTEEDIAIKAEVKGCYFKKVTDRFVSAGMQPLSCPIANLIMEAMERRSGLSPELLPITVEVDKCLFTMAKQATSDVVKE